MTSFVSIECAGRCSFQFFNLSSEEKERLDDGENNVPNLPGNLKQMLKDVSCGGAAATHWFSQVKRNENHSVSNNVSPHLLGFPL